MGSLHMFQDWRSNLEVWRLRSILEVKVMPKLVRMTSNIDLDLQSWNMFRGTHVYIFYEHISVLNIEIYKKKMGVKLTFKILKHVKGAHIHTLIPLFWCIKRWNRFRNGEVSEIDLQYWPRPPNFRVWPLILKHVKRNPHLYFIQSILVY